MIIIDNYETIVRNLVMGIRDGSIISKNSEKLNNLSVNELFNLFSNEFNLNFHKDQIITGVTLSNNILGIPVPSNCIFINNLYFKNIGNVNIFNNLLENKSKDNILYFDLNNVNVTRDQITQYIAITMSYVSYTREILIEEV